MAILDEVKISLRIKTNAFDNEIQNYIESCYLDLEIAGVRTDDEIKKEAIFKTAIITYCRLKFGSPSDYDRLKLSYDEQKAQLKSSSKYKKPKNG